MTVKPLLALAVASALIGTQGAAQDVLYEIDVAATATSRSGDAVNESGSGREDENPEAFQLNGLASVQFENGFTLQGAVSADFGRYDRNVIGFGDPTDNYRSSSQFSAQAGYHTGAAYFGAFGGLGRMVSSDPDREQDADFQFYGVAGKYQGERFDIGVQLGRLDSSAVDPETIDDAEFIRVLGQYFLPNERTVLQPSVMFMKGQQDTDAGPGVDDVEITSVSLQVEHLLNWDLGSTTASLIGGIEHQRIREVGNESANDTSIMIGLRFKFGGGTARQRAKKMAPRMANFGRVLGAVPVLD